MRTFTLLPSFSIIAVAVLPACALPYPTEILSRQSNPFQDGLNVLITEIMRVAPLVNGVVDAVAGLVTDLEAEVASDTKAQTTYNEFDENQSCSAYTLLFARGTTEPGNLGIFTGPALVDALKARPEIGPEGLTVQGLNNYTATFVNYFGGGEPSAIQTMYVYMSSNAKPLLVTNIVLLNRANQINSISAACPQTKLVVSGYSQGALTAHKAVAAASPTAASFIHSVLLFGDPSMLHLQE